MDQRNKVLTEPTYEPDVKNVKYSSEDPDGLSGDIHSHPMLRTL